jgi:Mrp family chromosome partitioning ATPase
MRIPGLRGRRLESAQKAKKELQLAQLAELPLPSAGAAMLEAGYDHLFQELAVRTGLTEGRSRVFGVTSALEGEGRSSVTANLAIAAARQGWSVLVVDTEVRAPSQHRLFGDTAASPIPGLMELLSRSVTSPSEVLRATKHPKIRLLPVGNGSDHDVNVLLGSKDMERFIQSIAPKLADLIFFDTPNVLSNEPGRRVLSHLDGVLYVLRLGETELPRAEKALATLARHEVNVIGGIFLSPGTFSEKQAVPFVASALQKPTQTTETSSDVRTSNDPPRRVETSSSETTEMKMPVNNATEKVAPADAENEAFGIEDLEAVLQGWRRRDFNAKPENDAAPVPPELKNTEETVPAAPTTTPIGVAFPMGAIANAPSETFLSVSSSEVVPVEVAPAEEENAPVRPVLTIVEGAVSPEPEDSVSVETMPEFQPVVPFSSASSTVSSASSTDEPSNAVETKPHPFAIPVIPVAAVETPATNPGLSAPSIVTPVVSVVEPEPAAAEAPVVVEVAPEPVKKKAAAAPVVIEPVVETVTPAPVVAEAMPPAPVVITPAPVAAPAPVVTPVYVAAPTPMMSQPTPPQTMQANYAPAPTNAVSTAAQLDVQIDMFQTAPGEMTMRAATTNALAAGYPHIALEMALQMNAMRGMRAITPSASGDPTQPRIALETVSTDSPEAARMRLVVGSQHEPALDAVLRTGESIAVRTGNGPDQPLIRLELSPTPEGGSVLRATLLPARGGAELTLEMRRDPVNDGFTDARWRNRLSLYS